ncbi:MAG: sigma-70 family RNA polymerase sigma factor [Planctomycetes bacterium]|nr:sigma-70 family RNA polymerase sigma factor [Planctomycetota bacterium]
MPSSQEFELETYLNDISKIPLLTPEEEKQLAVRVRKGDKKAREQMTIANLRLVVSIAKHYVNRGLAFMDLIEEGNIGLLKAVERFDPKAETRFSTYATWWIKQSIRRAITNTVKTVRIPAYMVEIISQWKNATSELAGKLGRQPTLGEIARAVSIPVEKVNVIKRVVRAASTANQPISLDLEWSGNDVIEDQSIKKPDEEFFEQYDRDKLQQYLKCLTDREGEVLKMRYGLVSGEPMTLEQIGNKMGLTRERIRQIEDEALRKLHAVMTQDEPEES